MTNEQIKQAYVVGKAAKGVLRYRYLQKQAMMKRAGEETATSATGGNTGATSATGGNTGATSATGGAPPKNESKPDNNKTDFMGGYGTPVLTGSAVGSILGALIQAARGKDVLNGLLVGGGLGGLGGAGYQAYASEDYKKLLPDNTPSNTQATPESNG